MFRCTILISWDFSGLETIEIEGNDEHILYKGRSLRRFVNFRHLPMCLQELERNFILQGLVYVWAWVCWTHEQYPFRKGMLMQSEVYIGQTCALLAAFETSRLPLPSTCILRIFLRQLPNPLEFLPDPLVSPELWLQLFGLSTFIPQFLSICNKLNLRYLPLYIAALTQSSSTSGDISSILSLLL